MSQVKYKNKTVIGGIGRIPYDHDSLETYKVDIDTGYIFVNQDKKFDLNEFANVTSIIEEELKEQSNED